MRYLCLGYYDPQKMAARPKGEMDAVWRKCMTLLDDLYKTGKVILDAGLAVEGRFMRRAGGSVQVTDGPFAEAKEIVAAAFLIEAGDMEEAVHLAGLHPTTRLPVGEELGWRLEIRPIDYFQRGEAAA